MNTTRNGIHNRYTYRQSNTPQGRGVTIVIVEAHELPFLQSIPKNNYLESSNFVLQTLQLEYRSLIPSNPFAERIFSFRYSSWEGWGLYLCIGTCMVIYTWSFQVNQDKFSLNLLIPFGTQQKLSCSFGMKQKPSTPLWICFSFHILIVIAARNTRKIESVYSNSTSSKQRSQSSQSHDQIGNKRKLESSGCPKECLTRHKGQPCSFRLSLFNKFSSFCNLLFYSNCNYLTLWSLLLEKANDRVICIMGLVQISPQTNSINQLHHACYIYTHLCSSIMSNK